MSIPLSQLVTWANQGATVTAKATADSVRHAIDQFAGWTETPSYEIYLQGSYKNDTNIYGDSDVDVVVHLNSSYQWRGSNLPAADEARLRALTPSTITWQKFRGDVLACLRAYYGAADVEEGPKCLKLKPKAGRIAADVVVCQLFRLYRSFLSNTSFTFDEGMTLWVPPEKQWIVNFPNQHYANGVDKNTKTSGRYKPFVRVVKNLRVHLEDHGLLADGVAASYFVECLTYNAPNDVFKSTLDSSMLAYLQWLHTADLSTMTRQSGQAGLIGTSSDQWPFRSAQLFRNAAITLWNEWS